MKRLFYIIPSIILLISLISYFLPKYYDLDINNLINNGDFSTDELVWSNEGLYLTSISNDELVLSRSSDGVTFYLTHNTINMIKGHIYSVSFVIDPVVNTNFIKYVDSESGHISLSDDIGLTTTEINAEMVYDGDSDFVIYIELFNSHTSFGSIDNFILVDITDTYSEEDEIPTYEEYLILIEDAPDYFSLYSYELEEDISLRVERSISLISSLLVIVVIGSLAFVLISRN